MKILYAAIAALLSQMTILETTLAQQWIQHINSKGLNQNEQISDILEDNQGNIWLATGTGIKKASAENKSFKFQRLWESFSRSNNDGLIYDRVNALAIDLEGCLWIGTREGISSIDPLTDLRDSQNWHNYTVSITDSGLKDDHIESVAVDTLGNIWFGTLDNGICIALIDSCVPEPGYDPYSNPENWIHFTTEDSLPHRHVYAIAIDGVGAIWAGTQRGTVRCKSVDRNGVKGIRRFDNIQNCRSIFVDTKGYIWFGTYGDGAWKVHQDSLESFQHYRFIGGKARFKYIGAIAEDADGFIWFGRAERNEPVLSMIDPKQDFNVTSNWVDFGVVDGLSGGNISSLLKDHDGNLWIGTVENGLNQYNDTWLTFVAEDETEIQGLTDNTFRALTIDTEDNLWIGTAIGDLFKLHLDDNPLVKTNWKRFPNPIKQLHGKEIKVLFRDNNDSLWIGVNGGVCRIPMNADLELSKHWSCLDTLNNHIIRSIVEDKQGYIWFGTNDGLWRSRNHPSIDSVNLWCEQFDTADGLAHQVVKSLIVDEYGEIWVGTENGVNKINSSMNLSDKNNWQKFTGEDGLIYNSVDVIFEDSEANLWFGTCCGVSKVNPNDGLRNPSSWESYTSANGLPSDDVTSIVESAENEIWIGTLEGLGRSGLTPKGLWTVYTTGDGLGSNSILSLAANTLKSDIWIGTLAGGITRYRTKKRAPETYLKNRFDIITEDIITYEYVGSDLTTPTYDLLYSYCFNDSNNGNDKACWSAFSSGTTTTLVIPRTDKSARYVFKVKAMDKDGNIDPTPATDIFWKIYEQMGGWSSMEFDGDTVKIYIPPKTYMGQDLLINQIPSYKLPDAPSIVLAFEISFPPIDSLNKPGTMRIILKNHEMLNATSLAIFKLAENSSWIGIGGTVEIESDSIISITTSFSEFATYAVRTEKLIAPALYSDEIHIQPRLFSPNGAGKGHGDRVTISFILNNDSPVSVKIYNLAGRMKRILRENISLLKGTNAVEWDGKDIDGNFCPTGLYIVTVEAGGDVKTKTVMVSNKY